MKRQGEKIKTKMIRNNSIVGETIEQMLIRVKNGEGIESIEDRDLVYNDNETVKVNPITDIRLDKRGLMLDETMGMIEFGERKGVRAREEEKEIETENQQEE